MLLESTMGTVIILFDGNVVISLRFRLISFAIDIFRSDRQQSKMTALTDNS